MDKKDYKKVDDEKLVTILDDSIRRSIGYYDSQISRERKKIVDFYNATCLAQRTTVTLSMSLWTSMMLSRV